MTKFVHTLSILMTIVTCALMGVSCSNTFSFPTTLTISDEWLLQTDIPVDDAERLMRTFQKILPLYTEILPFESKMKRQFTISLFKDFEAYNDYQSRVVMTKSREGFYSFDRGETAVIYRGIKQTANTLYHEGFHAYFQERIIRPPQWLNEGFAEYAETLREGFLTKLATGGSEYRWVPTLSRAYKAGQIPHLKDIVDNDWKDPHNLTSEQYAISWSLVFFFLESGDQRRALEFENYLTYLYNKKSHEKAFYSVWQDVDTLDKEWKAFIRKLPAKKLFGF